MSARFSKLFLFGGTLTIFCLVLGITLLSLFSKSRLLPSRHYSNADFGITTYQSTVDQDQDGIDDQTDVLQSARTYLATNPKYQSKYYATGYPDDEYGVCTDVVAFALLGAGYDLMELVYEDAKAHPEAYEIELLDKNIDFRRVKNLAVWFERHAQKLTPDRIKIGEWQGGDIVIFQDHIGIISDQRNAKGVPFLIHHASPFQLRYEDDVLETFSDDYLLGHYRIS